VDALSPEELAELAALIRERDHGAWDRQIDADFAEEDGCTASAKTSARIFVQAGFRISLASHRRHTRRSIDS
jgi:hypothetical protein